MLEQYLYEDQSAYDIVKQLSTSHLKREPSVRIVPDGFILPRIVNADDYNSLGLGGVCDANWSFVNESMERGFGGYYQVDQRNVVEYDFDVLYLGFLIPHWGVFLVDFLRRLYWRYLKPGHDKVKLAFIGVNFQAGSFGQIENNCREFFSILGIKEEDLIDIREPSKFRHIIIPEPGYEYGKYIYEEFLLPFSFASKNVLDKKIPKGKTEEETKLYLSRTRFPGKKEGGEYAIERFFKNNGYTIIYPETLSITKQIELFSQASVIASVEGTVAHNSLFMIQGKRQIIIRKQEEINPRQFLFNEAKQIDVQFIDCYRRIFKMFPVDHDTGPFLITYNDLIAKFADDNKMIPLRGKSLWNIIAGVQYLLLCIKCLAKIAYRKTKRFLRGKSKREGMSVS